MCEMKRDLLGLARFKKKERNMYRKLGQLNDERITLKISIYISWSDWFREGSYWLAYEPPPRR